MLRERESWIPLFLLILVGFFTVTVRAAQHHVYFSPPEASSSFPGGYMALYDTAGNQYVHEADLLDEDFNILSGFEPSAFSFAAIYDTGASGMLLGTFHAAELGIPHTGNIGIPVVLNETYGDVGIGGTETFQVSQPTYVRLAPTTLNSGDLSLDIYDDLFGGGSSPGRNEIQEVGNYVSAGSSPFKFQISSRNIPDIVGTPVLGNKIMKCNLDDWRWVDIASQNFFTLANTEFVSSVPTAVAGATRFTLDLRMQNFVADNPPVSTAANPLVKDVILSHNGTVLTTHNWLFDSGAQITIISKQMALDLGIDLENGAIDDVDIAGVGSDTVNLSAYLVDHLVLPGRLDPNAPAGSTPDELVFDNVTVFVSTDPEFDLPAELPAIFGMNLLSGTMGELITDNLADGNWNGVIDADIGNMNLEDLDNWGIFPNFSEWYFNGQDNTLTLFVVPLPGTFLLFAAGAMVPLLRRRRAIGRERS
jgi:hypothetical protein